MNARDSVIVSAGLSHRSVAGLVCLVLLLAGCAGGSGGEDEGIPQLSLSPVSAASPAGSAASPAGSAAGSGSAREQQIAAGAEAIRAYRQMIFDIYADSNPNVQDMRKVATEAQAKADSQSLRRGLGNGWRDTPGTVSIKWVKPVSIADKEMTLFACVDPNGIQVRRGNDPAEAAQREAADYVVKRKQDNWLVSGVFAHGSAEGPQSC